MSTRCYIAKQFGPGKYRTIYCNNDGYPEGVGQILIEHYNTSDRIDRLLELGDISVLGERLEPHTIEPRGQSGVTIAYKRDRGEEDTDAQIYTLKELDNVQVDYIYVYSNGFWKYFCRLADGMQFLTKDSKGQHDEENLLPF